MTPFFNFHRWHYDGNIHSEAADLNFAGALTGAPTVFAATAEENRDILFHKVKKISEETRNNTYSAQEMVEGLTLIRDRHQQNTIEYENINKEIDTVKKL